MSRRFRLQRVLELREQAEQEVARRLAAQQVEADQARAARDSLAAVRESARDHVDAAHREGSSVGALQHLSFVMGQLDRRLAGATDTMRDAEQAVDRVRGELEERVRDRRILERLREKHEVDGRLAEQAADRVLMDEIALGRFARQRDDAGSPPTPDAPTDR
jgi:flagellar export protein FliJ